MCLNECTCFSANSGASVLRNPFVRRKAEHLFIENALHSNGFFPFVYMKITFAECALFYHNVFTGLQLEAIFFSASFLS